jgi:hypothetical protein
MSQPERVESLEEEGSFRSIESDARMRVEVIV